jgi:hypothetical protein
MTNPRQITVVKESATYQLPTYSITNEGLQDSEPFELKMAKGNKEDENVFRQEGFFSESLIQCVITHLKSVSVGELKDDETTQAILKLNEALMWLDKRKQDRLLAGTLGTYKK